MTTLDLARASSDMPLDRTREERSRQSLCLVSDMAAVAQLGESLL